MARVQSAYVFDETWSMDAKDNEIGTATTPAAILQLHSPEPLLEERWRQISNRKSRARSRANTAQTHQEPSHSPNPNLNLNPTPGVRLQISDQRFAEVTRHSASVIDWDNLRTDRSSVWDKKKTLDDFGIYTRRSDTEMHAKADAAYVGKGRRRSSS